MGHKVYEEIMTISEAEEYLRIAPGTLKTWRHQLRGPDAVISGKFVRYLKSELDFWMEVNTTKYGDKS